MAAGPRSTRVGGTVVAEGSYSKGKVSSTSSGCPYWADHRYSREHVPPENNADAEDSWSDRSTDSRPGLAGDGSTSGCGCMHARAPRAPVERCCDEASRNGQAAKKMALQ